jgi:flagellar hook-associated protein 1
MIGVAIDNALRGLQASAFRSEIASRNITNATTDGYSRKSVDYASGPLGLTFKGIFRSEDLRLAGDAIRERATLEGQEFELKARTALMDGLGNPQQGNDLGTTLNRFEEALVRLGDRPEDATLQKEAVARAKDVAQQLNSLSDTVQDERLTADATIASEVTTVNRTLASIKDLNRQIAAMPEGKDRTDLKDERDRSIAALAERLPVRTVQGDNDQVTILTMTGVTLLDSRAYELSFTPAIAMVPAASYTGGQLSGLRIGDLDVTPGSGRSQAISGGTLGGLFKLRDQAMPEAQNQLDELASVMATSFQAADGSITDPAQEGGLFLDGASPHDRADVATRVGLAGRLTLNALADPDKGGQAWRLRTGLYTQDPLDPAGTPASDPGEVGEASQVRAFAAVLTDMQDFDAAIGLGNRNQLSGFANQITAYQGGKRASLESAMEYQRSLITSLDARLADETGVDLDKELQDILLFEKSYAASATVLQASQRMLDELLNIV